MIETTLLGGLIGGLFRLAPEALKWFDRKDERKHELAMFDKQLEADRLRSEQALAQAATEGQFRLDATGLEALKAAIQGQAQLTGVRWVDGLNASVRPMVTYWLLGLYAAAKLAGAIGLHSAGTALVEVMQAVYTDTDHALLAGVLNFWFLDRVIRKQQGR